MKLKNVNVCEQTVIPIKKQTNTGSSAPFVHPLHTFLAMSITRVPQRIALFSVYNASMKTFGQMMTMHFHESMKVIF